MPKRRVCSIQDCGKSHHARDWCKTHYRHWQSHGDPTAGKFNDGAPMRFILGVAVSCTSDECLIWPFGRNGDGSATVWLDGGNQPAARMVCRLVHGEPPTPKHEAAHSCGRGHEACVNGAHLSWKTHAENQADRLAHGTHSRGERHGSAKLTESDVHAIRSLRNKVSQREIGEMFGISQPTVSDIFTRRRWGWLA